VYDTDATAVDQVIRNLGTKTSPVGAIVDAGVRNRQALSGPHGAQFASAAHQDQIAAVIVALKSALYTHGRVYVNHRDVKLFTSVKFSKPIWARKSRDEIARLKQLPEFARTTIKYSVNTDSLIVEIPL
jgi:hypothetical protein